MSEPFVGEIRMFAGNFAPRSWAFCDGQLLAVSQNDALFSLLGTIYGGDGQTTFGLPDMRGRIPVHAGTGPGLSQRRLGSKGGQESVALSVNHLANHGHELRASTDLAQDAGPQGRLPGRSNPSSLDIYNEIGPFTPLSSEAMTSAGGSQSHTNMQPFTCIHFIIALFGIYPSQQ